MMGAPPARERLRLIATIAALGARQVDLVIRELQNCWGIDDDTIVELLRRCVPHDDVADWPANRPPLT